MRLNVFYIAVILISFCISNNAYSQYMHREGKVIIDADGNEFISRSMGLGGWMLMEGYMMETGGFAGTQHEIRNLIETSIGKEKTDEFFDAWLANHCTKEDIDSLASWGFNAVRPALHYNLFTLPVEEELTSGNNTWLYDGFKLLDNLVSWCAANEMYVFIDLHAAPGGQGKNADISDYDPSKPSLWESEANKQKTIALWKKIAQRYANNKWVGGYDLINETNWNFNGNNQNGCDSSNEQLRELMMQITAAIREVDPNHMIIIEGNCWANNMDGLFPPWDENMAYSFHKYWSGTDVGSIQGFLDLREEYNVPMWMGESGENSNQWFYETIQMLESQKVGWSWWPMKKISSVVAPLTIQKTNAYQSLLNTWNAGGTPEANYCYNTLMDIAENANIKKNVFHPDVIDAMFRQQTEDTSIPFKELTVPGTVNCVDFDMGRHDVAYHDSEVMNSKGNGTAWNNGYAYRNDGVDIEKCEDESEFSKGYNIAWIDAGEWMKYTVNVTESGAYDVIFRISSFEGNGKFRLEADDKNITGSVNSVKTSAWQNWQDVNVEDIVLYKGKTKLKFYVEEAGFNLNYIRFEKKKGSK